MCFEDNGEMDFQAPCRCLEPDAVRPIRHIGSSMVLPFAGRGLKGDDNISEMSVDQQPGHHIISIGNLTIQ